MQFRPWTLLDAEGGAHSTGKLLTVGGSAAPIGEFSKEMSDLTILSSVLAFFEPAFEFVPRRTRRVHIFSDSHLSL